MRRWLLLTTILGLAGSAAAAEPFATPMVTITFDDGWETQYTRALPLLREYDIDAVFYIVTRPVEESWNLFMTEAQVRELREEGHALESHTVSHLDLRTLDPAALASELEQARSWLQARFGDGVAHHFASPFGFYDEEVLAAARELYDSHRTVGMGRNFADDDPYELLSYDVHRDVTVAEVRGWLEETQRERSWIILTFHELTDGPPELTTQLDVRDFETILADIVELGLPVVSVEEGVRAMRERAPVADDEPEDRPIVQRASSSGGGCGCTGGGGGGLAGLWLLVWRRRRGGLALADLLLGPLLAGCGEGDRAPRRTGTHGPGEPDTPGLGFVGRFDWRDSAGPLAGWPGTRVLARFEGAQVRARLEELAEPWQEHGPSELDVSVDGLWQDKLVLRPGAHDYVVASGLGPGVHELELYRRSEAQNGLTRFLGLDLGDGRLLAPPSRLSRRLEVIGDSNSTGFGVEGVGLGPDCPGADWAARYQNFRLAWGARLGERLEAEVHGTVYSGKGIVRNIWREDPVTMPMLYGRANPIDRDSRFDLGAFVPDVVVLMMGGNDFNDGLPVDDGELSLATFAQGLGAFLDELRGAYPQARLVLVLSPSTPEHTGSGRVLRARLREALQGAAASRGDARLHFVEPPPATADELRGCNGHGTPEFHDRLAEDLEVVVRELTGW